MAKKFHDDVLDAALAKIATCIHLNFCSAEPSSYADIAGLSLASVNLTAGDGNGDYVIANDSSGRKLTVGAKSGIVPTANGTIVYAVLDDGTTLLAGTTVIYQAVTTAQLWDSPAFKINLQDPN